MRLQPLVGTSNRNEAMANLLLLLFRGDLHTLSELLPYEAGRSWFVVYTNDKRCPVCTGTKDRWRCDRLRGHSGLHVYYGYTQESKEGDDLVVTEVW